MSFWQKLHNLIDKSWRHTHSIIVYYFVDRKVEEKDIDWLNMHNNMMEDKKNVSRDR